MTIINKFLLSVLKHGDMRVFAEVPQDWLDAKERAHFSFIRQYYRDNGELPPMEVYADKYKIDCTGFKGRPRYYFKELRNRYISTTLSAEIPRHLAKLKSSPEEGLDALRQTISNMSLGNKLHHTRYGENAEERYLQYEEKIKAKGVTHLSTNIPCLDETMYGYQKGDLITIAGRSGVGKTWLLLKLISELDKSLTTIESDDPILLISNEMNEREIMERLDCIEYRLPYEDFMKGVLPKKVRKKYREGLRSARKSNIIIIERCNTLAELEDYTHFYRPAAVAIDASYMMEPKMPMGWEKIAFITQGQKRISQTTTIPFINTTQLHRGAGKGKKKLSIDEQDEFSYGLSYISDSDIAFRMYQTPEMVYEQKAGISVAKGRRMAPGIAYRFDVNMVKMDLNIELETESLIETPAPVW